MGLPIVQLAAFFPLLLPVWNERPLEPQDLYPSHYPERVEDADVASQREGLLVGNRELRATIYRHLRETGLPAARALLAAALRTETDPRLVPVVLQQLALSPEPPEIPADTLETHLRSEDSDTRYWAIRLVGTLPAFPPERLAALAANEPHPRHRRAASQAIADRGPNLPLTCLRPLWEHADPVVRAAALAAALRVGGAREQAANLPATVFDDIVPVRAEIARALAESAPEDAILLAPRLARDPHPSVRARLAQTLGTRAEPAHRDLLVGLVRDPDPEVRRQTAESLAHFPEPAARDALAALLGDPRTLVRRQAEESLVLIHPRCPVDQAVGERLAAPPATRHHAFRILGRIDSRPHAPAIAERLELETEPANLAAVIFALGLLETRSSAPAIAARADHPEPTVRAETAAALGRLADPATFPALQKLAFDPDETVRQSAIVAIGRTADGTAFGPTLLKVLQTVREPAMTSANRGAAAWAAARCHPVHPPLADRLLLQGTTPVVPGEMGEMLFEPDHVLAACGFALARISRAEPAFQPQFKTIHAKQSRLYPAGETPPTGGLSPSAELREANRQIRAWLDHQTPEPALRPTTAKTYDYGPLQPAR